MTSCTLHTLSVVCLLALLMYTLGFGVGLHIYADVSSTSYMWEMESPNVSHNRVEMPNAMLSAHYNYYCRNTPSIYCSYSASYGDDDD